MRKKTPGALNNLVPVRRSVRQTPFPHYLTTLIGYLEYDVKGLKAGSLIRINDVELILARSLIPDTGEPSFYLEKGDPETLKNFFAGPISDDRPDINMK